MKKDNETKDTKDLKETKETKETKTKKTTKPSTKESNTTSTRGRKPKTVEENKEEKTTKAYPKKTTADKKLDEKENKTPTKESKELVVDKKEVAEVKEETKDLVEVKDETKEVTEVEDKKKKGKKEKKLKLARLYRKRYSPRAFNRKVLKRLYIPHDKEFVKTIFIQEENDNPKKAKYYVPKDKKFTKKDVKRLNLIAKQVRKQKGRVKLVPLIASLSVIFVILFFFITMKNVLIKKVVKNLFENQFEARCDIAHLDLALLDSSFTLKGFEIANKDEPMKNIFSLDSLVIDFDLTQLLKKKFVAEEFSVEEIAVGSDRTYDGSLPPAKLKRIQDKKAQKAKEKEEKKQKVQQSFNNATNQVRDNVNNSIADIFNTFNPVTIIETCYAQLLTPGVVNKIQDETVILIDKWKETPDRVAVQVTNVQESANDIINFDYNSIKDDPTKIKDMLETFNDALKTIDGVRVETESLLAQMEDDVQTVTGLAEDVKGSVQHDIDVTQNEINKLTSFRLPSGQEFLASTIDIYGHELLGKYYPKLKELVGFLVELKDKQVPQHLPKVEKKEKKPKKEVKRMAGRDIQFTKDYNPKVWIKKIKASGFGMALTITDIANDMNKTNKPCVTDFTFKYKEITHGGRVIVDIRTETENPLVYVEYTCDGTSFSHSDGIPGVPQIKTNANYICSVKVNQDQSFALYGKGDFYNLNLTSLPFEPPYIFDIYKSILGRFDSAEVGLEIGVSPSMGLTLKADTDLDEKIASALRDEINRQLTIIKESIEKELTKIIKEYTDKAQVVIDRFKEIENKVRELGNQVKETEQKVRNKINELENRQKMIQEKAEQAVIDAANKAKDDLNKKLEEEARKREEKREQNKQQLQNKIDEGKKQAEKAAGDAIKGFLGGLKK